MIDCSKDGVDFGRKYNFATHLAIHRSKIGVPVNVGSRIVELGNSKRYRSYRRVVQEEAF